MAHLALGECLRAAMVTARSGGTKEYVSDTAQARGAHWFTLVDQHTETRHDGIDH